MERYIQTHFLGRKSLYFDSDFTVCSWGSKYIIIRQHWSRQWPSAEKAPGYYLNQCWWWPCSLTHICVTHRASAIADSVFIQDFTTCMSGTWRFNRQTKMRKNYEVIMILFKCDTSQLSFCWKPQWLNLLTVIAGLASRPVSRVNNAFTI